MTTLLALADRAQLALNDSGVGTWAQATIESWCVEAIRDYSQTWPRTKTVTTEIAIDNAGHVFDLPADFLSVVLIEFPTGEDPNAYLVRRRRTHDNFYDQEGFYDVEPSNDADTVGKLYLSEEPANGETYALTYTAAHDVSLASDDEITVREDHEGILILFVLWQAFKERAATSAVDPDITSDVLQKLVNAASQAEVEYRRALRQAEKHRAEGGWTGPWRADIHDPVY